MPNVTDRAETRPLQPWSEPLHEAAAQYERRPAIRAFVLVNILIAAFLAIFIGALAVVANTTGNNYIAGAMPGVLAASTFLGYFVMLREEMPRIASERFVHSLSLAAGQIALCTVLTISGLILVGIGATDIFPGHENFSSSPLLVGLLMSPAGAIAAALIATTGLPDAGKVEVEGSKTDVVNSDQLT